MTSINQPKMIFKFFMISFFAIAFLMLSPSIEFGALAADQTTQIEVVLCKAVGQLTGGIGRGIAIIVIVSTAFMLFLGKVQWGLAISIAVAMGLLFGAGSIVEILGGGANRCQAVISAADTSSS